MLSPKAATEGPASTGIGASDSIVNENDEESLCGQAMPIREVCQVALAVQMIMVQTRSVRGEGRKGDFKNTKRQKKEKKKMRICHLKVGKLQQ